MWDHRDQLIQEQRHYCQLIYWLYIIHVFTIVYTCQKPAHSKEAALLLIMQPVWSVYVCLVVWVFMRLCSIVLFISSALALPLEVVRIIILNLAHESSMQPYETS